MTLFLFSQGLAYQNQKYLSINLISPFKINCYLKSGNQLKQLNLSYLNPYITFIIFPIDTNRLLFFEAIFGFYFSSSIFIQNRQPIDDHRLLIQYNKGNYVLLHYNYKMMEAICPTIKALISPFFLKMSLKNIQLEYIVAIELLHNESKDKYYLQINQRLIESMEGLSKYYENPIQLYEELQQAFDQISIDSNGVIKFEVMIGKSKRRKITLETQKVKAKNILQQVATINQIIDSLRVQLQKKAQEIKIQQHKLAQQISQLKTVDQLRNEIIQQRNQILKLKQDFIDSIQVLAQMSDQNVNKSEKTTHLSLEKESLKSKNSIQSTNLPTKKSQTIISNDYFELDEQQGQIFLSQVQEQMTQINYVKGWKQHQDNKFFNVTKLNHNRFRLSKQSSEKTYMSCVHSYRVFPMKIVIIKVSVAYSQLKQILFGVCSQKVINRANLCKLGQCLSLNFQNSSVINGGKVVLQGNYAIQAKKTIEMEIDLIKKQITWKVYLQKDEPKIIHSVDLPKKMKNKPLFVHITMRRNQDFLDIITD